MNFEEQKEEMLKALKSLHEQYNEFTKLVSPSHWRTTGHHFTDLRSMINEVAEFTEMSEEQKADPKIQEWING